MAAMFSPEDMRRIIEAFPFKTDLKSDSSYPPEEPLIPRATEDGFVKRHAIVAKLNSLILNSPDRINIQTVAAEAGIPVNILWELIGSCRAPLNDSRQVIIPSSEFASKRDSLLSQLAHDILSFAEFGDMFNMALESIPYAIERLNSTDASDDRKDRSFDFRRQANCPGGGIVYSTVYVESLKEEVWKALREAQDEGRLSIFPDDKVPPTLRQMIMDHPFGQEVEGKWQVQDVGLVFTPTTFLTREQDTMLESIATSKTTFCPLKWFTDLAPEWYPDAQTVRNRILESHDEHILILSDHAASTSWFKSLVEDLTAELKIVGIIDVSAYFESQTSLPEAALVEAARKAYQDVSIAATNEGIAAVTDGLFPRIVERAKLDQIREVIINTAVQTAERRWEDTTLSSEEIDSSFDPSSEPGLLQHIYLHSGVKAEAEAAVRNKLGELEADATAQFLSLWQDSVSTRVEIHSWGCRAVTDVKLQAQLSDVLRDFVIKDLIPETISRAESSRLVRSAKLKKNIKKLQEALRKPPQTLDSMQASLQKFSSKMDVPPIGLDALATKKVAYIADLVASMQRVTDAPRLFLTCVVVLLARQQDGVVYATGKLAPKLLKIVKGSVSEEMGERLEVLKEAVKTGKVGDGERQEMRKLAAVN